jgi:ribA/ribD-fused uncharacterized protein
MNNHLEQRTYIPTEVIVFRKTKETFGGLSNMAPGFPMVVNSVRFWTCEALYQCCRFPDAPEVQKMIASQPSPMTAKMKSKRYRDRTRFDWDNIRVRVMRWCLRVKLAQNMTTFGKLLLSTGDKPIVEESARDQFWGAKAHEGETLTGANVLGRLLMELREQLRSSPNEFQQIPAPQIPNFLLLGRPIGTVNADGVSSNTQVVNDPASHQKLPAQKVEISGTVGNTDWDNLVHLLAESNLSPESVSLNIELLLSSNVPETPKIRMLAELARRLGLHFRAPQ